MKIVFVIPWYGVDISGGAEALCRATAVHLKKSGLDVEILTTCVRSFRNDWNQNFYPPGVEIIEEIPVRRFKVRKINRSQFHRINKKLMAGSNVSDKEEKVFIQQMIHSDDLIEYMIKTQNSSVFLLLPYMFGTTFDGILNCPDRSILIPCLHHESYAEMKIYEKMFSLASGVVYLSVDEKEYAQKRFGSKIKKEFYMGAGVEETSQGNGDRFKTKWGLSNYILYAGRKDSGKNIDLLIHYFCAYLQVSKSDLKLVLIGGGDVYIPSQYRGSSIIDLGFVSKEDQWDAYAGALVLCNPSLNESFSIVVMESWLAGVPVLVHEDCKVTRQHCESSQGGLYFKTFEDFVGCLDFFLQNPGKRLQMADNGKKYVLANFSWSRIVEKYRYLLDLWGFVHPLPVPLFPQNIKNNSTAEKQ